MKLITQTGELEAICRDLADNDFVAIDTEFMREKTFWPKLCLIQAAGGETEALIDPLANDLDLKPFLDLLADSSVEKVLHASRQDLEIFYQLMDAVPSPVFDTQIAAMALGLGDQIAYDALVREFQNVSIDKGSRFTDWSRRPLSDKQLAYALSDVTHLRDLTPKLKARLAEKDRFAWAEAEMEGLYEASLYESDPDLAWRRLKLRNKSPQWLAAAKAAAFWRESEAQSRDIPRNRILKDEAIYAIAQAAPTSAEGLSGVRGVPNGFERSKSGQALIKTLRDAMRDPKAYAPKLDKKRPLPAGIGPTVELLKVLLRRVCEDQDISPKMIATVSDLEQIAAFDDADVPAMKGWRREVFGQEALKLKRGEIALKIEHGKVVVQPA